GAGGANALSDELCPGAADVAPDDRLAGGGARADHGGEVHVVVAGAGVAGHQAGVLANRHVDGRLRENVGDADFVERGDVRAAVALGHAAGDLEIPRLIEPARAELLIDGRGEIVNKRQVGGGEGDGAGGEVVHRGALRHAETYGADTGDAAVVGERHERVIQE